MAFGVFKLKPSQRHFLSIIFAILNIIQVLTGVVMLSLWIYVYVSVAPMLYSERSELNYIFAVIGICGLNNLGCYLFGMKIRWKCLNQAYKKSTRNLVFAWTCLGFYIVFYLVILSKLTRKIYKHVIRAMSHSFYIGMSKYLKDPIWKITIDEIQYTLECCGSRTYKEWHEISWMNHYHVNAKSQSVKQFHENGTWLFPVTPWSCCRIGFPMQCLHDPLQQTRAHAVWTDQHALTVDSLNTEGCLNKMKVPIKWTVTVFVLMVVVNCIVQILILITLRILYTSCRNAMILQDPEGISPGWIFGRGDFGYNRGKTLSEIMYPTNRNRQKSSTNVQNDEENRLIDNQENDK